MFTQPFAHPQLSFLFSDLFNSLHKLSFEFCKLQNYVFRKVFFSSFQSFVSYFSRRYKLRCFVMDGWIGGFLREVVFLIFNIKHGRRCKGTFLIFFLSNIFPSARGNELDVLYFTCFSHPLFISWVFTFPFSYIRILISS